MTTETQASSDPKRPAPRRRKSRHTREEMLTQAAELFAERGYRVTSLSDLADRIGIAKATLFHHFRTKEEILFELYTQAMELATARIRAVDQSDDEPSVVLRGMFREHTLLILDNRTLFTIFFSEESELTEPHAAAVRTQQADYINIIAARVSQLIDSGKIKRSVHPRLAVQICLGAGSWTYRWVEPGASRRDADLSSEEIASTVADVMLDGLFD
ncbi:TetR/AcrR family transcriptional regulator [Nocardioides humi]|uniref:TetR/AcrR family transcriptional regulator n=1 Tax=Nocardioides humi TaxID=449461 RepID=UPI0015E831B7|nr:TetR/AcrR family transcriptional regulator [Nocardioides humi]